jgi:hypothetical protein
MLNPSLNWSAYMLKLTNYWLVSFYVELNYVLTGYF